MTSEQKDEARQVMMEDVDAAESHDCPMCKCAEEAREQYANSINAMNEDEERVAVAPAPSMAWLREIASKLEDGQHAYVSINDQDGVVDEISIDHLGEIYHGR